MRTYRKQNFRKSRKTRKTRRGGAKGPSSKKSSGNKGIQMKTFKRSGKGLKRIAKDRFKRASQTAMNVVRFRKAIGDAHQRAEKERKEKEKEEEERMMANAIEADHLEGLYRSQNH